ncbi:MAG TPA: cysteine desulfurase [Candidatus Melainabacteria bacterium]|nr:cysteine desulfurase [Candidatus Melainabacteria bacterium]HIN65293.1 cysteine desulfurase [Candidatus Obscuribacterales bacterium]
MLHVAIYLDNSATTPVRREVIDEMLPFLESDFGNPSSIHSHGMKAAAGVKLSRERVARLLGCSASEVYFSPCGTYSNNVAILGRARFVEANDGGRHLITTNIEHPSVIGPCQNLESRGWRVTYLPVDKDGIIDVEQLKSAISDDTSIISVMWANNEIGSLQPIEEIAKVAQERGIFFHTDAVQVPGKLPIDVSRHAISAMSLSGHKFYAPKGIGILYLKQGENVMPTAFGGGQEMGILPGTESVPNIVAIGKAAELAAAEVSQTSEKLRALQNILLEKLLPIEGLRVTGPSSVEKRLPGHVSVAISGAEGESLVMKCDLKGISVSSGSACHKGIIEPSSVLRALRLPDSEARGSLRISAGRFNSIEECEKAGDLIAQIAAKSARLSGQQV